METNLYDILGVDKNATDEELKKAYREKAKEHHPDKNPDKNGSHEKATEVTNAYAVLKNPISRKQYDETGKVGGATFDQRFFAFVGSSLLKIIEANPDVESVDIVQQFKEFVEALTKDAEDRKSQIDKQIKKAEKDHLQGSPPRITSKDPENKLGNILWAHISEIKKQQTIMEGEVKFIKDCAEVLEAYGYQVDEKPSHNSVIWEPVNFSFGTNAH